MKMTKVGPMVMAQRFGPFLVSQRFHMLWWVCVFVCKVVFGDPKKQIQGVCFIKKEGFHFYMSESVQFLQGGFVKILDWLLRRICLYGLYRKSMFNFYCWKGLESFEMSEFLRVFWSGKCGSTGRKICMFVRK